LLTFGVWLMYSASFISPKTDEEVIILLHPFYIKF